MAAERKKTLRSRRVIRCDGCALPTALCICSEVPRLEVRTRVVLFVHRDEALKPTNTARLVVRMLEGSESRVRGARAGEVAEPLPAGRKLVLFPSEGARVLGPEDRGEPLVLLVPDGSWTQARKAARRDASLAGVETVCLPPGPRTRYRLRRSPREEGLCTLEAVARALGILEGLAVEQRMMDLLQRFVDRTLAVRSGRAGHAWQIADDVLTGDGRLR